MSTFLEPVGPHESRVYWRRRVALGVVVLVVLFLLLRTFTGGDGGDPEAGDGAPVSTSSETSKATSTPKGSGKSTSSRSATTSAAAPKACKDDDVEVTARPAKSSYGTGSSVDVRLVVGVKGDVTCKRDVGSGANEIRVVDGDQVVWSSDFCNPNAESDVRTLSPDASYSVTVAWDGNVTPEDCPDERSPAPAGELEVEGRNGEVTGPRAPLTLG